MCEKGYMQIKRGDVYYADLSPVVGCEQGGVRPVLVLQNDVGNVHSPTIIAAAITSRQGKHSLPTHIRIHGHVYGLRRNSVILLEQVRTLDRERLKEYIGCLDSYTMGRVNRALAISLGLPIYRGYRKIKWKGNKKHEGRKTGVDLLSH